MLTSDLDPFLETIGREALEQIQLKKFQHMLTTVLDDNAFYGRKFREAGVNAGDVKSMDDLHKLPVTTKQELSRDQAEYPPYGSNLTYSRDAYTRIHQTSGTTGEPLRWLDTDASWDWWARCWSTVYRGAGVTPRDRIMFAFSFGPFIGFWSAYQGAQHIGALAVPGGGMSSFQRAKAILAYDISVLVCTPTYATHLAEVAEQEGLDIVNSSVNVTIQAGEPGGSLPATKKRIESAWGARCYDHAGATEVGAWGYECQAQRGLHANEGQFIFEIIDSKTGKPASEGELVVTNLGRWGMPIIRYKTGDYVKRSKEACPCGRTHMLFEGGVVGRIDGVLIVRGINIYPSAIENIVRQSPEVGEFAVDVYRKKSLDEMEIRIEVKNAEQASIADQVTKAIRNGIGLRVKVKPVTFGTLPRFDLKARRITDHRKASSS